ncbi:MAG: type II toxin-antitoxin system HigB family toxin [Phycisphaerales bacterium]|nr:type II toxin-antitoxin system HigB family toxin [Phycisphaerales bacterium]
MIDGFLKANAAARKPMERWTKIARSGNWSDIVDMRKSMPSADAIKGTNLTCFNIGGNSYRLIAAVSYQRMEIAIVELLTHAQYDKKYVR